MFFWLLSEIAVVAGFLFAAAAIAHMVRQRRSPQSALAWLLVMVLLPYVGVPLYLVFGGRKMRRLAITKLPLNLPRDEPEPPPDAARVQRILATYDLPAVTTGNRVDLCRTGEESYQALVTLIEEARESLYVTMFILKTDAVGADIRDRLTRRAAEGIDVRLLLDDWGSLRTRRRFLRSFTDAGGQVAYFMPLLHRPFAARTNLRNHRKVVIADGELVLSGGINIGEEYLGPTPKRGRWADLAFVLEGPATRFYCDVFRSDWTFAKGSTARDSASDNLPIARPSEAVAQVVPSGPDVQGDALYEVVLSVAFAAEERLWIVTPYFVPDDALLQALSLAARRGVDVRIIMPEKSNHRITDWARGGYLREIQEAGGEILLYTAGMLHAKVLVMDEHLAMVGSANMDMRSLFLNYEVGMLMYSHAEVEATAQWVQNVSASARRGVPAVGVLRDFGESVVRMVAPLL
jgi:cardiolipin synthase A/B